MEIESIDVKSEAFLKLAMLNRSLACTARHRRLLTMRDATPRLSPHAC